MNDAQRATAPSPRSTETSGAVAAVPVSRALTKRQREVLDAIGALIARNGYSPSLEEIGRALGLSSVATVHKHVSHLVDKGLVRRAWNQNRSIELVDEAERGRGDDAASGSELPLLGTIAAGRPLEAIGDDRTIRVPEGFVPHPERSYVLRVSGASMIEEQIRDGDLVVVERRETARPGETVVALLDESEATLKRYYPQGPTVRLQPANAAMDPIVVAADRVRLQGVVVGLLRNY